MQTQNHSESSTSKAGVWQPSRVDKVDLIISTLNVAGLKAQRLKRRLLALPDSELNDMLNLDFTDEQNRQSRDVSEMAWIPDHSLPNPALIDSPDCPDSMAFAAEALSLVLDEIICRPNAALTAHCILFILGKSDFNSETDIAALFKITRAAVSARIIELKDLFGLDRVAAGRSPEVREVYSERASDVHNRKSFFKPIDFFDQKAN